MPTLPQLSELERAKALVGEAAPDKHPEFACMLIASAIAGMRGLGMRHIRVGSLWWPDKFRDEPYLSMRGGWGCEGYSEADKTLWLSEQTIGDDGGFAGHTWLEPGDGEHDVVDLMHDNEGSLHEIYDADFKVVGRYIRRVVLERRVKRFWRADMQRLIRLGRESNGPDNSQAA
jgi:hypothetical protein